MRYANRVLFFVILTSLFALPMATRADETEESKFRDRVSWSRSGDHVSLRGRATYAYLVGGASVAVMITDRTSCDCRPPVDEACAKLCNLPEKTAVFGVDPLVGFVPRPGGKCRDLICLPDTCPRGLCPPEGLPLPHVQSKNSGTLEELTWSRSKDIVKLTSKSKDRVFWLLEKGKARLLFPGQSSTVRAPTSVYRFDCLGRFSPEFTPASRLGGDCPLRPCRDRALEQGLCPAP